jgi:hypothetical protein
MQRYEPVKWRTDLIVFIERSNFDVLKELNCTYENRRTNMLDKPMCTLIKYIPLKDRTIPKLNSSISHLVHQLLIICLSTSEILLPYSQKYI